MKIKEVTLGMSYTYQPAAYHSARGEASLTVELDEDDNMDELEVKLREAVTKLMLGNLAGVNDIHDKVYKKGFDPKDLYDAVDEDEDENAWLGE